ncbi:protein EARLY RESPONSIVE TO DEHYDRATION 15 [Iris pallida]|uniref:Protein EARLY RESPONSIVE TO DEHYDRATION 15 n=1 Tax=Iris pallida TaxID=29817 RepID=A0AAX6DGD0_IRIPA|nr:protein EARLY RESPONSIVE TO DEHYDRATION 15 [Iris pallida]KAJ6842350.1 protein EARLY RESPONSIVE TO DEHYDRATION 15 [Iris pallida]
MSSAAVGRSTLNPNAPIFIPAVYKQVEDFSPEWWELVNTTGWYRDHWFQQHQGEETFEREDTEDVANLLPDSIDLAITDDLSSLGADFVDEEGFFAAYDVIERGVALRKEDLMSGNDVQSLMRNLSLKSPRNGAVPKPVLEPAKCKPPQCVNLKFSPRRIIQQPR